MGWGECRFSFCLYRRASLPLYVITTKSLWYYPTLVLATVPNWRFGSGSGLEPNWNRCNGFYPIKKPNRTEPAVFWAVPHFRKLRSLAPIKFLSFDRITIWYIRKRSSFRCSFTTWSPIWDPITIRWVASTDAKFSALFDNNSMNSDRIANWRMGGERPSKTASFAYISYCDTITTQILNWGQNTEFAKMRLCSMINPAKKPWVYVRSGYQTRQDSAVRFFGRVRNRTEPFFRSKPGPLAGYPDPLLTLPDIQYQKLLPLHWGSFWRGDRERLAFFFPYKGCQYCCYV